MGTLKIRDFFLEPGTITVTCDGKGNNTQAWQDYGAHQGIPLTILIDASTGRIIARNLRGDGLRECLDSLL